MISSRALGDASAMSAPPSWMVLVLIKVTPTELPNPFQTKQKENKAKTAVYDPGRPQWKINLLELWFWNFQPPEMWKINVPCS